MILADARDVGRLRQLHVRQPIELGGNAVGGARGLERVDRGLSVPSPMTWMCRVNPARWMRLTNSRVTARSCCNLAVGDGALSGVKAMGPHERATARRVGVVLRMGAHFLAQRRSGIDVARDRELAARLEREDRLQVGPQARPVRQRRRHGERVTLDHAVGEDLDHIRADQRIVGVLGANLRSPWRAWCRSRPGHQVLRVVGRIEELRELDAHRQVTAGEELVVDHLTLGGGERIEHAGDARRC